MKKFITDNTWGAIREDLTGPRSAVTAIVSFIGASGETILPLRRGDSLVCNADESTIKLGLTNPETLLKFLNMGVRIYSIQGLHAKVIVGDDFAWIGSANASDSGLLEATVRVGKGDSRAVRAWARSLCTDERKLSPKATTDLLKIKPQRSFRVRQPIDNTLDWSQVKTLQLWWFDDYMSQKAEAKAQSEIKRKSISSREATYMRSLGYTELTQDDESVAVGQWIIPFNYWGPPKPCQVVGITPYATFKIVWFKAAKTARTPTLAEIETIAPGWRENYDDWKIEIRNRREIQQIGDLYS